MKKTLESGIVIATNAFLDSCLSFCELLTKLLPFFNVCTFDIIYSCTNSFKHLLLFTPFFDLSRIVQMTFQITYFVNYK